MAEAVRLKSNMEDFRRFELLARPSGVGASDDAGFVSRHINVDAESLRKLSQSSQVSERLRRQIDIAKGLGVTATPTVFLDGRPLSLDAFYTDSFWELLFRRVDKRRPVHKI